ncbi:MAG: energy coupling factor transporter S component ThiW, partial [Halanaerobium sp. MSAO_Bac5]
YKFKGSNFAAVIGELFGTGILGALAAYPIANFLMGSASAVYFFVIPFSVSSLAGVFIAYLFLEVTEEAEILTSLKESDY